MSDKIHGPFSTGQLIDPYTTLFHMIEKNVNKTINESYNIEKSD